MAEEEEIKFSEYQINLMKKIIRKKILYMEDGGKIFNIMTLIPGTREGLLKHIDKLEKAKPI